MARRALFHAVLLALTLVPLGVIACGDDDTGGGTDATGGKSGENTGGKSEGGGGTTSTDTGGSPTESGGSTSDASTGSGGEAPSSGGSTNAGGSTGDGNDAGTGGETDGGEPQTSCTKIADTCALIDPGTGPVHECVALRDSDVTTCDAKLSDCADLCGKTLCVRLGSLCHNPDPGDGPIHTCHEDGHANGAATCFDIAVDCYRICEAASASE